MTAPESRRARVERAGMRLREARMALGLSLARAAAEVDRRPEVVSAGTLRIEADRAHVEEIDDAVLWKTFP